MPSRPLLSLLNQPALHIHLPSISGLIVALLYLVFGVLRHRVLTFHWHAFVFAPLTSNYSAKYIFGQIYEFSALLIVRLSRAVVTTSPVLLCKLRLFGVRAYSSFYLSPSIPLCAEEVLLSKPLPSRVSRAPFRFLFIGRLSSYKRPDWLIHSLALIDSAKWRLDIVGNGPKLSTLQHMSLGLPVTFHVDLSDEGKFDLLAQCHSLFLLSDSSSEAFGIVQLESMCAGLPTFSLFVPSSGAFQVSHNPDFHWSGNLSDLPDILNRLISLTPAEYAELSSFYRKAYQLRYSNQLLASAISNIWSLDS